ncbi:MAG: hypothetical protein ACI32N_07355 [Bulleidia sp.]
MNTWDIAVPGIAGSIILFFADLSMGFSAAAVFIAVFFSACGVGLLLFPR